MESEPEVSGLGRDLWGEICAAEVAEEIGVAVLAVTYLEEIVTAVGALLELELVSEVEFQQHTFVSWNDRGENGTLEIVVAKLREWYIVLSWISSGFSICWKEDVIRAEIGGGNKNAVPLLSYERSDSIILTAFGIEKGFVYLCTLSIQLVGCNPDDAGISCEYTSA